MPKGLLTVCDRIEEGLLLGNFWVVDVARAPQGAVSWADTFVIV
jgi:hypothetical protein